MHLNCWKFWNINQHFCFFNETYLILLIKKSVQKMLTLFKDLYNNCQWRLGQMVLVFLTEMSRVWNSFPLNSTPQPTFNVSKKIFIIINKAKLIVQVKFYFPLKNSQLWCRFEDDKYISGLFEELWEENTSGERITLQLYLGEIVSLICESITLSSWASKRKVSVIFFFFFLSFFPLFLAF